MNKTPMQLILEEVEEMRIKHKRTIGYDRLANGGGELFNAYKASLLNSVKYWPKEWDNKSFVHLRKKTKVQRLVHAGAFLVAERQRLGTGNMTYRKELDNVIKLIQECQTQALKETK